MTAVAAEDRDRVGPYRVLQAIGAGGSARIDLARIDRAYGFQRHVVLKRPLEHLRGDPRVAGSLRREARIGGQLRHPNLVAILDAGIHDGYDYLVLEYVHGAALRAVMQADAPGAVRDLPLAVALAIVGDAARGMHEAHELTDGHGAPLGLVHRDVSPGNLLLGLDGTVKLADFGIAKETRVSTLSGSMHGTVTYMAPEQCRGHAFDRRADVFSLGVILYELVTGRRLFWADNDVASLHRVLSGAVPRPRKLKPQISSTLEDIVMTAVAHAPERRFATALELAAAVEHHAASAGLVPSARGIARAVEAVVGHKPVPWIDPTGEAPRPAGRAVGVPTSRDTASPIAAAPAPEVTPPPGGSLVELIAATGPDEPVEPSFGSDGGDGGDEAAAATLPSVPPVPEPAPAARPGRRRALAAGILAIGAIGGVAAALVLTRGSGNPAAIAAPAVQRVDRVPAAPAIPAPPPPVREADRPPAQAADDRATAPHDPVAPAQRPPPAAVKRRPHPASRPREPEAAVAVRTADPPDTAAAPAARAAGSGSAQPAARPATNVEWKPTLLLPTDGSRGRDRP